MQFHERLQEIRHSRELTQKKVADDNEISIRMYKYMEAGESVPKLDILIRLADYYEVSLDYLCGRTDTP